jgi:hypothetical protein
LEDGFFRVRAESIIERAKGIVDRAIEGLSLSQDGERIGNVCSGSALRTRRDALADKGESLRRFAKLSFSQAHRDATGEVLLEPKEVAQIGARHQLGVVSHPRLLSLPSRRAKSSIWSASAIGAEKSPAA